MKKKIDNLGRIVIPKAMLKELGIKEDVNIEIKNKQIIITNTKQMRTRGEIEEYMKALDTSDIQIRKTLEWVLGGEK